MFEVIELNESKNVLKSFNVIIYGTIRDIEQHFIKSFTNLDLLCGFFNHVYIIIFENDSIDNTRNLLTTWASFHNTNITKHLILEENLNTMFPQRAHRLAYCRNQIVNYIFNNNLQNDYTYAIHCDLDDRFWSLDYDSICNCFQYDLNSWDAMFPINTNSSYYDYWALRCNATWFHKNIFCCEIENNEKCKEFVNHIPEFYNFLKNNKNTLVPVQSAFNGIGIYKLSAMIQGRYNADYICNTCKGANIGCLEDNDHIGLHKTMIQNQCKLFMNTKMCIENKLDSYVSYSTFIINLKNIPNIQKDPLKYVLYQKIVEQNSVWLHFSMKLGKYENLISNFTTNNIITFCIHDNDVFSNTLINNNVVKYIGNLYKNINQFILNQGDALLSFIHIDFNNYHYTKHMFSKLHKKIKNGCIIVIEKFINFNEYLLNDLHAFYEFTQRYNIQFEYIGMNGAHSFSNSNTNVALRIINNPTISKIEITSDLFMYEDTYIQFDWIKYIENNKDLTHVHCKEDAWEHWLYHGKNEGRQYYTKKVQVIDPLAFENDFDWETYIELNPDLRHVKNKEEAWEHWIHHGKKEGRQYETIKVEKKESLEEVEDIKSFDWKKYIEKNKDLKSLKTKEEACEHWIHHGKHEGRQYYVKQKYDVKSEFDWKYYIENNSDLKNLKTPEEAWNHWNQYGKHEGRNSVNKNFVKFSNFDWKYYIENNSDLSNLKTKEEAWDHWCNHGKNENRLFKKKLKKLEFFF